jgi:type 1 fimbriae regulatory protein FimB/type 1 fimbriae regulatory protein FimE
MSTVPKIPQDRDSSAIGVEAGRGFLRLVETPPIRENETVGRAGPPKRVTNAERRDREHLTEAEVEALYQAAKGYGRNGQRDALMVWMAFRHGLRVGELVALRWTAHVDFTTGTLRVERLKNGTPSVHPLGERELRGLRRLQKAGGGRYVFVNERGAPVTELGFRKTLARIAARVPTLAGLNVHPHQLRHSCGFALANKGMDTRSLQHYLGHRRIENTVIYTAMAAGRFDKVWD